MYVRLNILGEMGPSLGLSSPRKARILGVAKRPAQLSLPQPQKHRMDKVSLFSLNSFLFL